MSRCLDDNQWLVEFPSPSFLVEMRRKSYFVPNNINHSTLHFLMARNFFFFVLALCLAFTSKSTKNLSSNFHHFHSVLEQRFFLEKENCFQGRNEKTHFFFNSSDEDRFFVLVESLIESGHESIYECGIFHSTILCQVACCLSFPCFS